MPRHVQVDVVPALGQQHRLHLAREFQLPAQRLLLQVSAVHLTVATRHHQDVGQRHKEIQVFHHRADAPRIRGVPRQHHRDGLVVLVDGHHHVRGVLVRVHGACQSNAVQVQGLKKGRRPGGRPRRTGAFRHEQRPALTVQV